MSSIRELIEKRAGIIEQMKDAVTKAEEARAKGQSATDYDTAFEKA